MQKAKHHFLLQFCLLPLDSTGRVNVLLVNWGMFSSTDPQMRTVLREQRMKITDRRKQIGFEGKPEKSFSWNCLCVARVSKNKIQIKHFAWNLQKSLKLSKQFLIELLYYLILSLTIIFKITIVQKLEEAQFIRYLVA